MDVEKGPPKNTNVDVSHVKLGTAWLTTTCIFAFTGAIAAIAAAGIAGSITIPAPACSTTAAAIAASEKALTAAIKSQSNDLHSTGALPFMQRAYMSVKGSIDEAYLDWQKQARPIGANTARLAESGDSMGEGKYTRDGQDGKTAFGFGPLAPILTIGEYDPVSGYVPVGVPDGIGAIRKDRDTMRMIYQSESYGHLEAGVSWQQYVNKNGAKFIGSHITYIDYKIPDTYNPYTTSSPELISNGFADSLNDNPGMVSAAPSVLGAGSVFDEVYNLKGVKVVARNGSYSVPSGAHYGDTSAAGDYVSLDATKAAAVSMNSWTLHSLCSSHLEEAHQWGNGLGVVDDMWVTNEEWTDLNSTLVAKYGYSGLSAHVVELATRKMYAVGVFGLGGFEKVVEFNCGHADFTCFSISGYNGNFGDSNATKAILARKKAVSPKRKDGSDWVYPQNIVPIRMYIGRKGYTEKGAKCSTATTGCTFLERNGLAFGQVYGFAVPNATKDRDAFHKNNVRTNTDGHKVTGAYFAPIAWKFNSSNIQNVEYTDMWEFQEPPVMPSSITGDWKFWTPAGRNAPGDKTEHNTPSPTGEQKFAHGSNAGYFGVYEAVDLTTKLADLAAGALPDVISATYDMIEGTTDVDTRIKLCPAGTGCTQGDRADGKKAVTMNDGTERNTLRKIDGLEWIAAKCTGSCQGTKTLSDSTSVSFDNWFVIQEDAGNYYGDRMFITKYPDAQANATHNFIAQAGGKSQSRNIAKVSVPARTWSRLDASEFSGVFDVSGVLRQTKLGGLARREADLQVEINDKSILLGLQHHSSANDVIAAFGADRGGQIYWWDVAGL